MSYEPEDPKTDWWANQVMIWFFVLWVTYVVAKIYAEYGERLLP